MAWTDFTPTATSDFSQLEPTPGYGLSPYGDDDITLSIHSRGWGSPITEFTDVSKPITIWTDV